MKKRRLKKSVKNLLEDLSVLIIGFIGAILLLIVFFAAVLQTSYRLAAVTPEEIIYFEAMK